MALLVPTAQRHRNKETYVMALSFTKLHDTKLEKSWNEKPARDPLPSIKDRIVGDIKEVLAKLKGGESNHRGWYKTKEGHAGVACQIRVRGKPLTVEGRDTFHTGDAAAFYSAVSDDVSKGNMDNELRRHLDDNTKAHSASPRSNNLSIRKPRNETPEQKAARTAKRLATIAAKKAGKK